jgi:hypothetical protein
MANVANPKDWRCIVITSNAQRAYYEAEPIEVWTHPLLEEVGFDLNTYNDILQDPETWQKLMNAGVRKALIIQDDGMLLRPGVEKFMEYDYVGAPWADSPENEAIKEAFAGSEKLMGNGGLSLRSVDAMLRVAKEHAGDKHHTFYHNINRIPEDVWFVKYLLADGYAVLPDVQKASHFSMEQVMNSKAIGFHKFWLYHPMDVVKDIFSGYLSG